MPSSYESFVPSGIAKNNVVRQGRRFAGVGMRAKAPIPFLHLNPVNRNALENLGVKPKPQTLSS